MKVRKMSFYGDHVFLLVSNRALSVTITDEPLFKLVLSYPSIGLMGNTILDGYFSENLSHSVS